MMNEKQIKIFSEQCVLNENGKRQSETLLKEVDVLLGTANNETEARIIGGIISNIIGKRVSDFILANRLK